MNRLQMKNAVFKNICSDISIWYLLLCTLFYYSAVYDGIEWLCYMIYYGIPLIYIFIHYKDTFALLKICFSNKLKYYILAFLCMGIGSILLPLCYGTDDFSYFSIRILQIAKESIKIVFLIMLFIRYISPECNIKLFIKYFVLSTCIYVLSTCVIICIPGLRDLLLALNKADKNTIRLAHKATYITRFGWCGFSGFTYSLKCSLAAMMMCYLLYQERFVHFYENVVLLFLCMLGNLFYGRVGIIASGLYFIMLLFVFWRQERVLAYRLLKLMMCAAILISVLALCSSKARSWLYWAFQSLVNLIQTGNMETTSSQSLKRMYFMPKLKTFLIGDARYMEQSGTYYMGTDIGLLRPLLFGGILFQLFRYSTVYVLIIQLKDDLMCHPTWLVYLIASLFVIFELKGEAVFPIISIIFAIVLLAAYAKTLHEKEKR